MNEPVAPDADPALRRRRNRRLLWMLAAVAALFYFGIILRWGFGR